MTRTSSTPQAWLDQMFDPCGVYRPVREHGVLVDFERVFLNAAGRVLLMTLRGDESVTSMIEEAPSLVESGLFEKYVGVAESGIPWTGLSQPYSDDKRTVVLDLQAWRVPEGIAITYRDISERERLADELTRSERRFRETVEALPDAVAVYEAVREDGRIVDFRWVYANARMGPLTGYSLDQLVGRTLLEVFPEHVATGQFDLFAQVVETGEPWREPVLWYEDVWGDGVRARRAFDVQAAKVGDGYVVVARDVTAEQDPQA